MLEQLIKTSKKRLVLISPYLKLNVKIKSLLEEKGLTGTTITIVYGKKKKLDTKESEWLSTQSNITLRYCQNLHAKCYLNDSNCIITSMNLYDFSEVNNHEMGILLTKKDGQPYHDAVEEANRIVHAAESIETNRVTTTTPVDPSAEKLSTSKLAKKRGSTTSELLQEFVSRGLLEIDGDGHQLTKKGEAIGGESRKGRFGAFFAWPADLE